MAAAAPTSVMEKALHTVVSARVRTDRCVVVANGALARIFSARRCADARTSLVEHAGLTATGSLQDDRAFTEAIVAKALELVRAIHVGKVLLVAPAPLLGFLREPLQHALAGRALVMALARDYTSLAADELREVLDLD